MAFTMTRCPADVISSGGDGGLTRAHLNGQPLPRGGGGGCPALTDFSWIYTAA